MEGKAPRYKIEREIGRGAFGVVLLAYDNRLGRQVALKALVIPEGTPEENRSNTVRRFHREARAAAGLSHPNIVTIYDISKGGDRHYISMEYLEGETLFDVLEAGALPVGRSRAIADQVLEALEYAHGRGVIHRDIKPENIFVLPGDKVKLVDFGIAHVQATTTITVTGKVMGSPGYMAPECVTGETDEARSDIFSFGVVLYEMLTGRRPFGPHTDTDSLVTVLFRIVSEDPEPPASINPDIPRALEVIVLQCLEKDPDKRFSNAAAVRAALSAAVAEGAPLQAAMEPPPVKPVPETAPGAEVVSAPQTAGAVPAPPTIQVPREPPRFQPTPPPPPPRAPAGPPALARPRKSRKGALIAAVAIVIVVAVAAAFLVYFLTRGNVGKARALTARADRLLTAANKEADEVSKALDELGTGLEQSVVSTTAEYEKQAAAIEMAMTAAKGYLTRARAEYRSVERLGGAEEYKEYAAVRVESIDVAAELFGKLKETLEEIGGFVAAVESGDTSGVDSFSSTLTVLYDEMAELTGKYQELDSKASSMKQQKGL